MLKKPPHYVRALSEFADLHFLSIKYKFCYTFGTLVGKNYRYNFYFRADLKKQVPVQKGWCLKIYFRIVKLFLNRG